MDASLQQSQIRWHMFCQYFSSTSKCHSVPAGSALATIPWLQTRFGLGFELWNCYFFSVARYHAFWFLGAYSRWVPMPNPTRFVPHLGWTPLTALSKAAGGPHAWLLALGALASQLAASLQQATQSGPALAAGIMSLLQVDPCTPLDFQAQHLPASACK